MASSNDFVVMTQFPKPRKKGREAFSSGDEHESLQLTLVLMM